MAIDVRELTKNKSMKMSDEDIKKVVSNYMAKIVLEQLEGTMEALVKIESTLPKYLNENEPKEDSTVLTSTPCIEVNQHFKGYSTFEFSNEFNGKSMECLLGDLAA